MIECPYLFVEDSKVLLGKTDIFAEIDYDTVYKRIETKRMESEKWLVAALNKEVKPKDSSESTKLAYQLYEALCRKTNLLNQMRSNYAYEEEKKRERDAQFKAGKTWLEIVFSRNGMDAGDSELRKINNLREYFSEVNAERKYVVVLSARDECASQWGKFVEASGLPLCVQMFIGGIVMWQ